MSDEKDQHYDIDNPVEFNAEDLATLDNLRKSKRVSGQSAVVSKENLELSEDDEKFLEKLIKEAEELYPDPQNRAFIWGDLK